MRVLPKKIVKQDDLGENNMFKKFLNEMHALLWTLCGSIIVIITLSGITQKWGLWLTISAFALHIFGVMIKKENE